MTEHRNGAARRMIAAVSSLIFGSLTIAVIIVMAAATV
jgi:hypothetical protein